MGWTYAFPNPCEPERLHGSYLSGIAPGKNFQQLMSFSKYERWMEGYALRKWESTLNLCVHAHGHDVDPIMVASCNNNYFLDIGSSSIHVWSFATVVPTMIVLLWFHFSDKLKQLSSMDLYTSPTFTLILCWVLPPWYLEIIMELHNFLWVLHQVLPSHWFQFFAGFELLNTQRHR